MSAQPLTFEISLINNQLLCCKKLGLVEVTMKSPFVPRNSLLVLTYISKLSVERLEADFSLTNAVIGEDGNSRIFGSVQHASRTRIHEYNIYIHRDQRT
jgi:hypothetical protein